jgi:hypothetical protein
MASKSRKKVKTKISVLIIIFLFIISIVFFDFIKGVPDKETLKNLGYSGMEIVNYKVNDLLFSEKTYSSADFNFNSILTKTSTNKYAPEIFSQEIYIKNKLDKEIGINMSILINIDYDKIRWNGTEYNLKDYTIDKPLKLDSWTDSETGDLFAPNIFFDEIYNKRINYKDVAEQGGYALVYQDKEMNYIELVIKDKKINVLENSKIDPIYANATDGFSVSAIGASLPYGTTTNGSDFWIVDYGDMFVYHTNRTGGNMTDGFSTVPSGAGCPYGITTNGSDFWIGENCDMFVYHTNRTGGNMTGGFSLSVIGVGNPYGITTNGSDFWIIDFTDAFVYHTNRIGGNMSDGFSTSAIGAGLPSGGITTNGSDFWITDPVDTFVYHTNRTGGNMSDGFKTDSIGSSNAKGITTNVSLPGNWGSPTDFWLTDEADKFVYHLYQASQISFINPTPDNATATTNTSILVNVSIFLANLTEVNFNWDGTNYSLYDNSLILMYNFENKSVLGENTTYVVDLSKYGNNGICSSVFQYCPRLTPAGKYGNAMNFSGMLDGVSCNFDLGNSGAINNINNNQITVSSWVYIKNYTTYGYIISNDRDCCGTYNGSSLMSSYGTGKKGRFAIWNSTLSAITTSTDIPLNTWVHLVGTYNGTDQKIYLNGRLENSKSTTNGLGFPASYNTYIGRMGISASYGDFNGSIDEVRAYNRTFSDSEVYELYSSNLIKFNQTQWYLQVNHSNLTGKFITGNHNYSASIKNTTGNYTTEVRTIEIVGESCIYVTGNWLINISDNCVLNKDTDLGSNLLNVYGNSGVLKINSKIFAKQIQYTPTDFTKDFIVNIAPGGMLLAKI